MLPIVVKALQNRSLGHFSLRKFLSQAWQELHLETDQVRTERSRLTALTGSRRERLEAGRLYDLAQRAQKSKKLALEALQQFLTDGQERWLEKSLSAFETAERYQSAHLKMRMNLAPILCERLTRLAS